MKTYPDDSSEVVKTDIVVNNPPVVTTLTAGKGTKVPNPTSAIMNLNNGGKDPVDGYPFKVTWTKEPDISTKGPHKGSVEVEYPDGTKKTEIVTVNVTDGFKAPDGVTITVDEKTGKASATITKDAPLGTFSVPVEVTYKDGTTGTTNVPVSVTGEEHNKNGEDIYYGDQTMTKFIKTPFDVHKTTGDASVDAQNFLYSLIERYDWDRATGKYNKTATYTLSADGKTYVSDKDSSDTIDAANIQLAWQDNYKLNTNADNFKSKTGDTLVDSGEEITGSDDGISGNSKYRYNVKITDYNTLNKLGLAWDGYNS